MLLEEGEFLLGEHAQVFQILWQPLNGTMPKLISMVGKVELSSEKKNLGEVRGT
jgi:hypothetical protein